MLIPVIIIEGEAVDGDCHGLQVLLHDVSTNEIEDSIHPGDFVSAGDVGGLGFGGLQGKTVCVCLLPESVLWLPVMRFGIRGQIRCSLT